MSTPEPAETTDFIRSIITADVRSGKHGGRVQTRFPPEPNGYLHIGHAKSICLNFGVAAELGGSCNLRFDDTNPVTEETEYVESIKADIRWLGFEWGDREYYASDYFDRLHELALLLIRKGKAYVDHLSPAEIRDYRGSLTRPGRNSPHRDRSVEENLELFERMRRGEFREGECVLRAKIDMAHPNMNMRDPPMYRIKHASHHRTGDKWCIYPMYDWAHGQCDAFEEITHSLCTLEFEHHRPLYDWFLEQLPLFRPRQIEFARLNLTRTVMSKRKLLRLVKEGHVAGWDDPRMPTLCGLRRRGYTPEAIRRFSKVIGIAKYNSVHEMALLEHVLREDLNRRCPRVLAVLRPLKVVIENWPADRVEELEAINNPEDPAAGTRKVPFGRELWIERDDFRESPPKEFHRLAPGREVRLRWGYLITCREVRKDPTGEIVELRCTYDPATRGGQTPDGRKVKGTIHWVSVAHALAAEVRLYDYLLREEAPEDEVEDVADEAEADEERDTTDDFFADLNPDSLQVLPQAWVEPGLADAAPGDRFQFERLGYFCADPDSRPGRPVFNRIVTLRDTWAKVEKKLGRP